MWPGPGRPGPRQPPAAHSPPPEPAHSPTHMFPGLAPPCSCCFSGNSYLTLQPQLRCPLSGTSGPQHPARCLALQACNTWPACLALDGDRTRLRPSRQPPSARGVMRAGGGGVRVVALLWVLSCPRPRPLAALGGGCLCCGLLSSCRSSDFCLNSTHWALSLVSVFANNSQIN